MSSRKFSVWNNSPSSSERSKHPDDASNRVYTGFLTPAHLPDAVHIQGSDGIFAMGSCFAREIEGGLRKFGFNILSMDMDLLARGNFSDEKGVRTGFFHRFNLPAMELELRRAFDDMTFDEGKDLIVRLPDGRHADLNYWPILDRLDLAGTMARRLVGRTMIKTVVKARAVILTLGLTEAWYHEPSGMYCNGVSADVLARYRNQFSFRRIGFEENVQSLRRMLDFIRQVHVTGDYSVFVTVSPVPLQATFSDRDIVVANTGSKAILRAVAEEVCTADQKAVYFPSYEIAMLSDPSLVWRPDRLHIQKECVRHIVDVFTRRYTDRATLRRPSAAAQSAAAT
jgi:hypothetical protein